MEVHANGVPALRGEWLEGQQHGRWLRWREDGSFESERNYVKGRGEGVWRVKNLDGLIAESVLKDDANVSGRERILPPGTPMPEWRDGQLVEGTRYASHKMAATSHDGFVTIPFATSDDCPGGQFLIDGVLAGTFPVKRHALPPGDYLVEIRSGSGHCAGHGKRQITIRSGKELVLPPESFSR